MRTAFRIFAALVILSCFCVAASAAVSRVSIYYFYTQYRTPLDLKAERHLGRVMSERLSDLTSTGKVSYQAVNVDLPENQHYITDYKFTGRSIIMVLKEEGVPKDKVVNLSGIWGCVGNMELLADNLRSEINSALASTSITATTNTAANTKEEGT